MMIDLSKPIRRKIDGMRTLVSKLNSFYAEPYCERDVHGPLLQWELERDYENIPEPRKPREWWAAELSTGLQRTFDTRKEASDWSTSEYRSQFPYTLTRMIEWPENAPLPDWPE